MAKGIITCATFIFFSTPSLASNLYITGSLGQAKADIDSISGVTIDDKDTSYSLGLGYKINDYIAIEGGYRSLGEATLSSTAAVSGTYLGKSFTASGTVGAAADATGFFLGGNFSLPVTNKFSAHLKAGLFNWDSDITGSGSGTITYDGTVYAVATSLSTDEDGTDLYYGLGASYQFSDNVGVGAQWLRFNDVVETNVDVIEATISYSF